jgi:hypothetical protein
MILRILSALFLILNLTSYGQDGNNSPDIELGSVWFKEKSTKLTKDAKITLDSFMHIIQDNPTMHVRAVSYNKDFCDRCGVRSWRRATAVLTYLAKHGISNDRLSFTNQLEGELNKVDLLLTSLTPNNTPAPLIRNRDD